MINVPRVILISGKKMSGKDHFAKILERELLYEQDMDFYYSSFAEVLKDTAQQIFMLSKAQMYDQAFKEIVDPRWNLTPREILQKFGTEVARNIHPDTWVINTIERIKQIDEENFHNDHPHTIFITDCRFPNEVELPKKEFGEDAFTIRINRKNRPKTQFDNHLSEISLDNHTDWDYIIDNKTDDLKWLANQARNIIGIWRNR